MAMLLTHQHAEQGRFVFPPQDLDRLRSQLTNNLVKANRMYEEYRSQHGQEGMDRLLQGLQAPGSGVLGGQAVLPGSTPQQPEGSTPSAAQIAAALPKGLRVEDLKPPPKRQRTKDSTSKPSPAGATPESARTPANAPAESPRAVPAASPATKKPSKRRRTTTSTTTPTASGAAKTPGTGVDAKDEEGKGSSAAVDAAAMPPPELPLNALGLDVPPHAAFFKARNELEEGGPDIDVWSALTNAMQEYQDATAALRLPSVQAGQPGSGSAAMGLGTGVGAGFGLGEDVSDEELFAQFIDFPPLPEGDNGTGNPKAGAAPGGSSAESQSNAQNTTGGGGGGGASGFGIEAPTPELYFPSWTAGDGEDDSDLSPESIRTVGSTSGMIIPGPMGVTPSTGHRNHSDAKPADGKEQVHGEDHDHGHEHEIGQGGMNLLSQSPASGAYNGGLFAWEDYDMSQSAAA
jgi:hypothetical protein